MKCKIKEYSDNGTLHCEYTMRMSGREEEVILFALKEYAGKKNLSFGVRAQIVDMVKSIQDPEVAGENDEEN